MGSILLYVSLAVVVLWTARLAWSKGFKPWLWAGASILLLLIPEWDILGMLPMFILLFLRRPRRAEYAEAPPEETTCSNCHSLQDWGHKFCDKCGWDMERTDTPETIPAENTTATPPFDREPDFTPAASDPPNPPSLVEEPEAPAVLEAQSVAEPAPVEEVPPEIEVMEQPAPEQPPQPPEKVFSGPPTPARMTERGIDFLRQGRFQEAIDQFTKAIALDPNYKLAWENRAEAYGRMGRNQQAAEDRRRLEAF
ncbi:MAG: tetratricopeptide repeat protein [Dehalococcoidia bacterium]